MAQVFNRIEMDIRTKIPDIITAVQNDSNSRFLDVFLFDGSTPINLTGHEVRIYCRKPENGGEVFNNGEITEPTNGRCQFPLTDQTLAKVGYVEAQIVLYYNNVQILQSLPFTIHVVESLISSGSVESSNEYGALVVLYQNLYESYDLMTTMVQNQGNKSKISTDRNINTFWESMEYVLKYMDTDLRNLLNQVLSEANVQGVIDRLGNTADTGATETTGTVMGKLNNLVSRKTTKVYRSVSISVPANSSNLTLLSVAGAGEFYGVLLANSGMTIVIDGVPYVPSGSTPSAVMPCRTKRFIYASQSTAYNVDFIDSIAFKESLTVILNTGKTSAETAWIGYALYE